MSDKEIKKHKYKIRAKIPMILRVLALSGLVLTVLIIGIGFYWNSGYDEFRLKPQHTQLSKEVIGVVNGYERTETDSGIKKYFIKADKATTFADNHQELENVYLQVFDEDDVEISDKISGNKAIYIPAKDNTKNFTIYFAGDVDIKTRYNLNIQTEQIAYDKATEIADSESLVEFQRENISGRSFGAVVNIENKTLDLLNDVEVNAYASDNEKALSKNNLQKAKLKAGKAFVEQIAEKIKLENGVEIYLTPNNQTDGELTQPTDIKANQATAYFTNKEIRKIDLNGNVRVFQKPTDINKSWTKTNAKRAIANVDKELKKLELFENVQIETTANDSKPTRITASKAIYEKELDRFELENNVEILTVENAKPTKITAGKAIYEQTFGKVFLSGNAQVLQGGDVIKGNIINAELFPDKKLRYALANGNAYLKQVTAERTTEVKANELNAEFNQNQKVQKANAVGNSDVVVIPVNSNEYTRFGMSAPKAINLDFRNDGTLSDLKTEGRTTIKLNSPNNSPESADKKLTADKIYTVFRSNGNELAKATAIGDAELIVEPHRASPGNYKSVANAPRFDCEFYAKNNARNCLAKNNAEVVRYPTVNSKSKQTLSANNLNALFDQRTQDVERFDANGRAKFSEADRNGIADQISYTANDEFVRLRGGEPTVWDSNGRAKASEVDWDTKNNKSNLRGNVSTTYYSQKQTNGSTPFTNVSSPVFITASNANFDHDAETALYTGNARAWQDKNYVRAERLFIQQKDGQMFAEGKVQSMLYDVNRTVAGRKSKTPVYASADRMLFQRKSNLLRYEDNVDIRQGQDRIVAGLANVYLDKNNELSKTVIEKDVVITQPNRRATGTFAQYNATDESVILRGNPAQVSDAESGASSGKEVIVYLKENRVEGKGKTNQNDTGRIRTVYKIKDGKIN